MMSLSGWPNLTTYREVVQDPVTAFADPELQQCQPEVNPLGLPIIRSGGFVGTFHLIGTREWAVRCFVRPVPDLTERYRFIAAFLQRHPRPYFVPMEYHEQGIRVDSRWFPIVKMPWVRGETLVRAVASRLDDPAALEALRDEFSEIALDLEHLGAAHGDLADDNILLGDSGQLLLIDYDCMYVPGMPMSHSIGLGKPGYQHPGRLPEHFDATIDRFAATVLYITLDALSLDPTLYQRRQSGDTLLFSQEDLLRPLESPLMHELDQLYKGQPPERQRHWRNFRILLNFPFERLPSFERFLGRHLTTVAASTHLYDVRRPYPVLDAADRQQLLAHVGQYVEVHGTVRTVVSWQTRTGRPCLFVNFGEYVGGDFYVVLWEEALRELAARKWTVDRLREALCGERVAVTGVLATYRAGARVNPQIEYQEPGRLVVFRPPQRGGNIVI